MNYTQEDSSLKKHSFWYLVKSSFFHSLSVEHIGQRPFKVKADLELMTLQRRADTGAGVVHESMVDLALMDQDCCSSPSSHLYLPALHSNASPMAFACYDYKSHRLQYDPNESS